MRMFVMIVVGSLFLSGLTPAAEPPADPFKEGAIWVGDYRLVGKDDTVRKWAFTITERKGESFKAEVTVRGPGGDANTINVEGKAPTREGGAMSFKVERKGFLQGTFRGKLQKGEVALIFAGVNSLGRTVAGSATLKPKN